MAEQVYEARLLDCFQKGKELRTEYWQDCQTAREQGKFLISGSLMTPTELFAGIPSAFFIAETYAANVSSKPDVCVQGLQAVEARGFARDMCGYFRNDVGSALLNHYLFGGQYPRMDFCFSQHCCEARGKWYQVIGEHFGIPVFLYERPAGPYRERGQHRVEYMAAQLLEGIEWMEKVTGREYDDEKFIQALRTSWRSQKLWVETCLLNRAVPAPLALRWMLSLMETVFMRRHDERVMSFLETFRDETKYRIAQGIAASPVERVRLMADVMPPWASLKIFRYTQQKYGAPWVGIWGYCSFGPLETAEDGTLRVGTTPDERGMPLRNREEAVRALAQYTDEMGLQRYIYPLDKIADIISFARHWRAGAVVLHYNRACPGLTLSLGEVKLALQAAGIPVTSYEATGADPRETDERLIFDSLDAFLESVTQQGTG